MRCPLYIGHPDLALFTSFRAPNGTVYVSVREAVERKIRKGEPVEIHWEPTPLDDELLADVKERSRQRFLRDSMKEAARQ